MAMAAVLRLLSVFLLLLVAGADDNSVDCDKKSYGSDATTVATLIDDLKRKVPDRETMQDCNVLTSSWSGRQVYGYAYCSTRGRSTDPVWECRNCLANAGAALIRGCGDTGAAGEVWGPISWCYIQTGTSNCAHMIH